MALSNRLLTIIKRLFSDESARSEFETLLVDLESGASANSALIVDDDVNDSELSIIQDSAVNDLGHYYGVGLIADEDKGIVITTVNSDATPGSIGGQIDIYQGNFNSNNVSAQSGIAIGAGSNLGTGEAAYIELNSGQGLGGGNGGYARLQSTPTFNGGDSGEVSLVTGYVQGGGQSGNIRFETGSADSAQPSGDFLFIAGGSSTSRGAAKFDVRRIEFDSNAGLTYRKDYTDSYWLTPQIALVADSAVPNANDNFFIGSTDVSAGTSHSVTLFSGKATATASSGLMQFASGEVTGLGNSGVLEIFSGDTVNGNSGNVAISTGAVSGSADSGFIILTTGSVAGGTRGRITLDAPAVTGGGDNTTIFGIPSEKISEIYTWGTNSYNYNMMDWDAGAGGAIVGILAPMESVNGRDGTVALVAMNTPSGQTPEFGLVLGTKDTVVGGILINTHNKTGVTKSGDIEIGSGDANALTGDMYFYSGNSATAKSGDVTIGTGNSPTTGGTVYIASGGGGTQSGHVDISVGGGTTRGDIKLNGRQIQFESNRMFFEGQYNDPNYWVGELPGLIFPSTISNPSQGVMIATGDIAADDKTHDISITTGQNEGPTNIGTQATGALYFESGYVLAGAGNSGNVYLNSGGTVDGNSGSAILQSGYVTGTGNSGSASVATGPTVDGASGLITIHTGAATGTGNTGNLILYTGETDQTGGGNSGSTSLETGGTWGGNSGQLTIFSGYTDSGNSGLLRMQSGDSDAGGDTGNVTILSGNANASGISGYVAIVSGNTVDSNSGDVQLTTGNATGVAAGSSGTIHITTGNATFGNSGNINLTTGTDGAGGTRGKIRFQDGTHGTAGHVWTSTDVNGSGEWAPASSGPTTLTGTASVTVPAIGAGSYADVGNITITGLVDGDSVLLTPPNAAFEDGMFYSCYVSAPDTLTINIGNMSGIAFSGTTANWRYLVFKS